MQIVSPQPAQSYGRNQNREALLQLLTHVFPNAKRRSKQALIRDHNFNFQEWVRKLASKELEAQVKSDLPNRQFKRRGFWSGFQVRYIARCLKQTPITFKKANNKNYWGAERRKTNYTTGLYSIILKGI